MLIDRQTLEFLKRQIRRLRPSTLFLLLLSSIALFVFLLHLNGLFGLFFFIKKNNNWCVFSDNKQVNTANQLYNRIWTTKWDKNSHSSPIGLLINKGEFCRVLRN